MSDYLPTTPGTQISVETSRRGPCWRCRFHLRWPPWRKHWGCGPRPVLTYIDPPPAATATFPDAAAATEPPPGG